MEGSTVNEHEKQQGYSERAAQELEVILGEMQAGWRVAVERVEPEWASGHVGSHEYDRDEPVSLDWIKAKYGGHKFKVRIYDESGTYKAQRTVKIDDYPRRNGNRVKKGIDGRAVDPDDLQFEQQQQQQQQQPPPPPPPQNSSSMENLLALVMQNNSQVQQLLIKQSHEANQRLQMWLMDKLTSLEGQQRTTAPGDAASELSKVENLIGQVQGLQGTLGTNQNDMLSSIAEKVMDLEMAKANFKMEVERDKQTRLNNVPPLPPPPGQQQTQATPPPQQQQTTVQTATAAPQMSDADLIAEAMRRLNTKAPHEKAAILDMLESQLYEEETDDSEEIEEQTGQSNAPEINSSVLDSEDQKQLQQITGEGNGGSPDQRSAIQ